MIFSAFFINDPMRKIVLTLSIFSLFLFTSGEGWAKEGAGKAENFSFLQEREEWFRYRIKWNFFTIGSTSIGKEKNIINNGNVVYPFWSETKTVSFLSKIYPLFTRVESLVDEKTFLPLKYICHFIYGNRNRTNRIYYEPEKGTGLWTEDKKDRGKEPIYQEENFNLPSFFQDPLSTLYYLRRQSLEVGKVFEIPISANRKNWNLEVKVIKKRPIRVLGKVYQAFILEPSASLGSIPFTKGKMWLWLSADKDHIPLYISAKAPYFTGVISITLIDAYFRN